jgi:hypothetical protein
MELITSIIKFIICAGLVCVTLSVCIPITIFDLGIGAIVSLFGGDWKFSSFDAWGCIFDHWSKGEFMF